MQKTPVSNRFPTLDQVAGWYGITREERAVLDEMARRALKMTAPRTRKKSVK